MSAIPPQANEVDTGGASDREAPPAWRTVAVTRWQGGECLDTTEAAASEAPVALVYNGISHAVMMATPHQLADFALGFSLTEGIIERPEQIYCLEVSARDGGIAVDMAISSERHALLRQRQRALTGPTGCGLCGAESLRTAIRPLPIVGNHLRCSGQALQRALASLGDHQSLQAITGASHAAAWVDTDGNIRLVREDVGRHNALDKVIGAVSEDQTPANGFLLVSSRASYELVAKSAAVGVELLVAISAPTTLAIELADAAGLTLVGFARPGRHSAYAHPHRLF